MLARLPLKQYNEWKDFWTIRGPTNEERMDWRFANVISWVVGMMSGKSHDTSTFMPHFGDEREEVRKHQKALTKARVEIWANQHSPDVAKKRRESRKTASKAAREERKARAAARKRGDS